MQWVFWIVFGFVTFVGVICDHLSRDLSSRIQVTLAWTAFPCISYTGLQLHSTPYPRQGRPTRYTSLSLRKWLPVATPEFLAAPVSQNAGRWHCMPRGLNQQRQAGTIAASICVPTTGQTTDWPKVLVTLRQTIAIYGDFMQSA